MISLALLAKLSSAKPRRPWTRLTSLGGEEGGRREGGSFETARETVGSGDKIYRVRLHRLVRSGQVRSDLRTRNILILRVTTL